MTPRLRLALDENFPTPLVAALREYIREVDLVPVREIDTRLTGLDDWQLLLALHLRRPAWAGMVTADAQMLSLPREVCVLKQTGLALVVAESAGRDPLIATGVLLAALPRVAERLRERPGGIFRLRPPQAARETADDLLGSIAKHRNTNARALYRAHKLTKVDLARDVFGPNS